MNFSAPEEKRTAETSRLATMSVNWPPADRAERTLARAEREQARSAEVLSGMEEGVVVLNSSLIPVMANPAARRALQLGTGGLPPQIGLDELDSIARRCLQETSTIEAMTHVGRRHLRVRAIPLEDGVGLVLYDVTDELGMQQLRKQFAANASHELKTPVASLATLAEAVQSAIDKDPDAARRFAERMSVELQRLEALIAGLMDLSRVEDPAAMRVQEVDLSVVARQQAVEMREAASAKQIDLAEDVEDELRVRGDRQHLELLVRNLLDNAISYTGEGGRVQLQLKRSSESAVLHVADSGIGIPLHAQSRVFERFFRVDQDRARVSGGTGLGLSIVKNVAESHGGSVAVTSELDEGSVFSVILPLLGDTPGP